VASSALEASVRTIERAAGPLATASVSRMDDVLPWFSGLPATSAPGDCWSPAGVRSFVEWLRRSGHDQPHELSDDIFDAAPRTLARSISLQHTVQLIQVTIDVVEEQVPHLVPEAERRDVADAVMRFSREVAFSAARVYARAAESRGTWDARLQALLVDALLRGDPPTRRQPAALAGTTEPGRGRGRRSPGGDCRGPAHWHRLQPAGSARRAAGTAAGWSWCSAGPRLSRPPRSSAPSATVRWCVA
jgi:hypothetical protein